MSPVNEHKILREVQRALNKPTFGTRSLALCAVVLIASGTLLLAISGVLLQEGVVHVIAVQGLGGLGGFFVGLGTTFWISSQHMRVIAPHISLESIEKRIEELES